MKKNRETTIDELAIMIQKGFEESDKRMKEGFKESDKRMNDGFEESDKRMKEGFKESDKQTDNKIEALASMVQKGFESMDDKFSKKFEVVHEELKKINKTLVALEKGQEDLKLRQDNVPYRFELKEQEDVITDHDKRIRFLERKVLLAN
jgi:DNA anti-recombination protein RmuC